MDGGLGVFWEFDGRNQDQGTKVVGEETHLGNFRVGSSLSGESRSSTDSARYLRKA